MNSLMKGNVQSVTMAKDGGSEKMFIEASPQWKTMNVYNGQVKPLSREQKQGLMVTDAPVPGNKQAVKSKLYRLLTKLEQAKGEKKF